MIEANALAARHSAVGLCRPFGYSDPCLTGPEPCGFAASQLSAAYPLTNPLLLMALASVQVRRMRRRGYAETEQE
jgi:hypothetical protein